ncbi:SRPBCC family protein [Streptomyces sp. NBC_00523]|uniref:SRPBCC family protein n=1 Tax=unclassified Streptomyces TaxID=2593676 RepID=UPI002E819589|nr:SRPBCC family protein [Streptomyces sp. NBC_00523]WUD04649.1 SRPBCC family protein [Streptomyces sp. NBC_00523]
MTVYDLIDEAIVDAPPEAVWAALIAEFRGAGRWWVPANTFATVSGSPDEVGAEVAVTVHTKGVDKGGPKLRFTARTRAVEPQRLLSVDYVSGVFRGTSDFYVEPLDGGRTKVGMHFVGRPNGFLKLLAKVADIGAEHSTATSEAFVRLGEILAAESAPAARSGEAAQARKLEGSTR